MPSFFSNDTERSDSRPAYSYKPNRPSNEEKATQSRSNGAPVQSPAAVLPMTNGLHPYGLDGTMQSMPNGRTASFEDSGRNSKEGRMISRDGSLASIAGAENERRADGYVGAPKGKGAPRDDGYFATQAITKDDICGTTTHVHLDNGGEATGAIAPNGIVSQAPVPGHHPEHRAGSTKGTISEKSGPPPSETSLRVPGSAHRLSSPPAFHSTAPGASSSSLSQPPFPNRLQHRHTLEVPKPPARTSRDTNPSEEVITATGRFSPSTPTRRRGSMTLARRTTRSIHSDMHLDEVPQDEDAARWTELISEKRAAKRKKREEEDDDRVVVGTKVDQHHVNWVTAYNMLTGIRFTVSRTNAKMDRELTDADFEARQKFSFDITGNELTPSAKYDFKFKDYAPWVFRHLRANFRLDPADYLMSLTSKYILSELGSPGKSGSFFYFSRDYKYIIKTIHHAEHKFLRKILKEYYTHVTDNPNTLLSQFYGLHRVKIPYGRKIHFVVMNNLFPPHRDIHRTFDLKGSTIGRDYKEEDLERNPRATLKDLNWLRRDMHLEFGPTKKKAFMEQMQRDVKLLQRLHIMDYSLLVGIHDLERGNEENLRDKTLKVFQPGGDTPEETNPQPNMLTRTPSKLENARKAKELRQTLRYQRPIPMEQAASKMPDEISGEEKRGFYFYQDDGGFRASHEDDAPGEEIYYLGIIDCLTHYSFIKRMEHFLKSIGNPENQISAIPPGPYGDRFVKFITGITKTREVAEMEKAAGASGDPGLQENIINDPRSSGGNPVVQRAEQEAERSKRRGANESNTPDRKLGAVRSSSAERGDLGTTLPVVDEAAESSSQAGRSGRSQRSNVTPQPSTENLQTDGAPREYSYGGHLTDGKPPPTPPKDRFPISVARSTDELNEKRPLTPPKGEARRGRAVDRPPTPPKEANYNKALPMTPPRDELAV